MKFLVSNFLSMYILRVLAACLAVSAASPLVTLPNGAVAPAYTPEVAAARAAHLRLLSLPAGMITHLNGAVVPADTPAVYAAKQAHAAAGGVVHIVVADGLVYHTSGAVTPVETADVAAARAAHFAAHLAA